MVKRTYAHPRVVLHPAFHKLVYADRVSHKCRYVLDVGGNLGQEPIIAGQHGLRTFTFEPFPSNVASLEFNSMLNCVHHHVKITGQATSDTPGVMCFDKPPSSTISNAGTPVKRSSLDAGSRGGAPAPSASARSTRLCLNLTTLDVELERSFDPDRRPLLLKIDNEVMLLCIECHSLVSRPSAHRYVA